MSLCCCNSNLSPPCSQQQLTAFFAPQKNTKRFNRSQKPFKVVAYHPLKTPSYKLDALEPHMSRRTLEVHWGKHHRGYVEGLNKALGKSDVLYGYTLDELVKVTYNNGSPLPEFNNTAQPIISLDIWEDIFLTILGYDLKQNDKVKYVNTFMDHLVSWNAAMSRMARAEVFVNLGGPTVPVA